MPSFECLYHLDHCEFIIVEVKLNGLSEDATAAEKFHWLKIEKKSFIITALTFASMDSSDEIEERYFEEGFLKFNTLSGTFIEKYNSAQYQLSVLAAATISEETVIAIEEYFALETKA